MKYLTDRLDKVANELQEKGLDHLAMELDKVSNTLETDAKKFKIQQELEDRINVLIDWLILFNNTELAGKLDSSLSGMASNLSNAVQKLKEEVINSGDIDKLLDSPAIKKFKSFLNERGLNNPISDRFFFKGQNTKGFSWGDLEVMFEILSPTDTPTRNKFIDLKDISKHIDDKEKGPGNISELFEKKFTKLAAFIMEPKFHRVDLLLKYLQRKGRQ